MPVSTGKGKLPPAPDAVDVTPFDMESARLLENQNAMDHGSRVSGVNVRVLRFGVLNVARSGLESSIAAIRATELANRDFT